MDNKIFFAGIILLVTTSCERINQIATASKVGRTPGPAKHCEVIPKSIHDGDTIRVRDCGNIDRVRFCGIDAPELKQAGGSTSQRFLYDLLKKADFKVGITPIESDRYGRTVGEVFIRKDANLEIFVNDLMIRSGNAWHYKQYSGNCPNKHSFNDAEIEARSKQLGIWKSPNPQPPWEWRKLNK